jgi:hypothetical protein
VRDRVDIASSGLGLGWVKVEIESCVKKMSGMVLVQGQERCMFDDDPRVVDPLRPLLKS